MSEPRGCELATHSSGIDVFLIHYSADRSKDEVWKSQLRKEYPNQALWDQEQEISNRAFEGKLVYPEFRKECTVVDPFPLPLDATHWMGIDPHPRTPHAFLWMAVDRYGNHIYFREYWPSKIYGKRGNVPEDDELYNIDDYVTTLNFLEGQKPNVFAPNGYADNQGRTQTIHKRIMDPAGKAWATERQRGKDDPETFWQTYHNLKINCEEAKKDFQAGRDKVGTRLRPKIYMGPGGQEERSQIIIFSTLKELILELQTYRYPTLKPSQVGNKDPDENPKNVRCHMLDILRYLEMADPYYVEPKSKNVRELETPYSEIPSFKV